MSQDGSSHYHYLLTRDGNQQAWLRDMNPDLPGSSKQDCNGGDSQDVITWCLGTAREGIGQFS